MNTEETETWEVTLSSPDAFVIVTVRKGASDEEILQAAINELTYETYIWSKSKV